MRTTRTPKTYFEEGEVENVEVLTIAPGIDAYTGNPDEDPSLIARAVYAELARLQAPSDGRVPVLGRPLGPGETLNVARISPCLVEKANLPGTLDKYSAALTQALQGRYDVRLETAGWGPADARVPADEVVGIDVYVTPVQQQAPA